ncbi:MAG: PD-(D/E)XK nuclease family protein, partial [Actinomycetota bacterium]
LAAERRQPVSDPVVEVTIGAVLAERPGMFESVAEHGTTITALREAHQALRLAGVAGADALAASGRRGAEVTRISRAVTGRLRRRWYDEVDVIERATELLGTGAPAGLRRLVIHLPQALEPVTAGFARRLAAIVPTTIVVAPTGDDAVDGSIAETLRALDAEAPSDTESGGVLVGRTPDRVVITTDADDEVRVAVRTVMDAARGAVTGSPVPFERIGVFWPSHVPHARLVEHHLEADDIPWNGRGGIAVAERIAPRLLLDLLDVDRRSLRRSDLFDLLADVPVRDETGRRRSTAEWHRVARAVGVSDGTDWRRLRHLDPASRWASAAEELADFVDDLGARLGRPDATRTWREWSDWCVDQLGHWLGPRAEIKLSDADYRAWEALMRILDRLRWLDHVSAPVSRRRFRSVLASELDDAGVREGRIGTGVLAGSLASAIGLDLEVAIVIGAVEGMMPPPPRTDPLLAESARIAAGLPPADAHATRLLAGFRSVIDTCTTVVVASRGDLRATTERRLTRWLDADEVAAVRHEHDSAAASLRQLTSPPGRRERRLRDRLRSGVDGDTIAAPHLDRDPVLRRALVMRAGRRAPMLSEFDGDLSGAGPPPIGDRPVSPTRLQTWASCPHAYFERYLLGVRPIEEVDRDISIRALDSGSLQHEVLDRLHHDVLDGRLPQPERGWTDAHRTALLIHFDDVCSDTERRGRTGRPATWAGARARLRAELLEWMRRDGARLATHGGLLLHSEHDFGRLPDLDDGPALGDRKPVRLDLPDGRSIPVFGSVDRIDRWADGTTVVTDHKTGRDHYQRLGDDDPTLGGTVFQLPAYAAAAAMLGAEGPIRAEYSMFEKGKYARRGIELTPEVVDRVSHALDAVVAGIEGGWFPQRPDRPGWRLYVTCEHCDPDGIGTEPAWNRWVHKRSDPRVARWFADETDPAR